MYLKSHQQRTALELSVPSEIMRTRSDVHSQQWPKLDPVRGSGIAILPMQRGVTYKC